MWMPSSAFWIASARARTGAVRIFVGAEFDQLRLGETTAQRDQVVAGIVGAQFALRRRSCAGGDSSRWR
jgi:hypothetical protein